MGQYFLAILGALAVDKRRKESWLFNHFHFFSFTLLLKRTPKLNL